MCSSRDFAYAVPHAERIGLTAEQLARECDGCLKRVLLDESVTEAANMVRRSRMAEWATELDRVTLAVGVSVWCHDGCARQVQGHHRTFCCVGHPSILLTL